MPIVSPAKGQGSKGAPGARERRERGSAGGACGTAPQPGGWFPQHVCPVGPSLTVPRSLAGGSPGACGTAPQPGGWFPGRVCPVEPSPTVPRNLAGGSPGAFAQLGHLPKCPAARRVVPRARLPSWAISHSAPESGGWLLRALRPTGRPHASKDSSSRRPVDVHEGAIYPLLHQDYL